MKILVIEDEPSVLSFIHKGLTEEGYIVETATDGEAGLEKATNNNYDVVILDIMLPKKNGVEVSIALKNRGISTPVLMLTALDSIDHKVEGLEAGADDYMTKPFAFAELLARLRALVRRQRGGGAGHVLTIANLTMDTDARTVTRDGRHISLTPKEFAFLEYLMRNRGRVVTRAEIAKHVWDIHFDTGTNVVDVYVNFLRKKIDKDSTPKLLHTIVGVGYVLKVE